MRPWLDAWSTLNNGIVGPLKSVEGLEHNTTLSNRSPTFTSKFADVI